MWRKLGCVVFCFLLSGCIYMGRDFSVAPVRTIENDVTTQKEILRYFGEPARKGLENGYKIWLIPISLSKLLSAATPGRSTRTVVPLLIKLSIFSSPP
jgi:hypothetical protein